VLIYVDNLLSYRFILCLHSIGPGTSSTSHCARSGCSSHLLLLSKLLLLLADPLILSFIERCTSAQLTPCLFDLLHKAKLTHLLDQFLIVSLLLGNLLLFQLLLPLLLLEFASTFLVLLHLLHEKATPYAVGSAILSGAILNQESPEGVVLSISRLVKYKERVI